MNTFKYCLMTIVFKKKIFYSFTFMWALALFVVTFQFLKFNEMAEAGSLYSSYFIVSFDNFFLQILLYVTPFLGAYLYGDICIEQQEFRPILLMRTSRMKLNVCNIIVAFVSSFIMMFSFLMLTLIFTYIILQSDSTVIYKENYLWNPSLIEFFEARTPLAALSRNFPLYRIMIYIVLFSLYSGLSGLATYTFSLFMRNKVVIYISAFTFFIIVLICMSFIGSELFLQNLLNPQPSTYNPSLVIRNALMMLGGYTSILVSYVFYKVSLRYSHGNLRLSLTP